MEYIDQSHEELNLFFSQKASDLKSFKVISESHFDTPNFKIHFGVLTESHFAIIETGNETINEIFACTDIDLPGVDKHDIDSIADEGFNKELDNHTYEFKCEILPYSECESILKHFRAKRSQINTQYQIFDFPNDDDPLPALTEVYVTVNGVVKVESLHTYPNEDKAVFSTSIFAPKVSK